MANENKQNPQNPVRRIVAVHLKANIGGFDTDNLGSIRHPKYNFEEETRGVFVSKPAKGSLASALPEKTMLIPWGAIRYVDFG